MKALTTRRVYDALCKRWVFWSVFLVAFALDVVFDPQTSWVLIGAIGIILIWVSELSDQVATLNTVMKHRLEREKREIATQRKSGPPPPPTPFPPNRVIREGDDPPRSLDVFGEDIEEAIRSDRNFLVGFFTLIFVTTVIGLAWIVTG